jgi:predicted transcriptional regulator
LLSDKEAVNVFKQLKAKLERGAAQAAHGELLDGDSVFEEMRQLIEERRRAQNDEVADYVDLRDRKVKAQMHQANLDIRAGRVRPAEDLLKELKATSAKRSRHSK